MLKPFHVKIVLAITINKCWMGYLELFSFIDTGVLVTLVFDPFQVLQDPHTFDK